MTWISYLLVSLPCAGVALSCTYRWFKKYLCTTCSPGDHLECTVQTDGQERKLKGARTLLFKSHSFNGLEESVGSRYAENKVRVGALKCDSDALVSHLSLQDPAWMPIWGAGSTGTWKNYELLERPRGFEACLSVAFPGMWVLLSSPSTSRHLDLWPVSSWTRTR